MGLLNNSFPLTLIALGQQTVTGGLASTLNPRTASPSVIIALIFITGEKLTVTLIVKIIMQF